MDSGKPAAGENDVGGGGACRVSLLPRFEFRDPLRRPLQLRRITHHVSRARNRAFTLLEIMIVVGIMGIMLTIGVPIVYKVWHRDPINQAVKDTVEVLSNARARAILQGREMDVVFHPKENRLEIRGAGGTEASKGPVTAGLSTSVGSGTSAHLPDKVLIELLDINKLSHDFRDDDEAVIRFFPDGTCDELSLVLVSDQNQRREITLEITTALASVENDPRRFH